MVLGIAVVMELENYTSKPQQFFDILPNDWKENIVPFWESIKSTTQLFVLVENNIVLAGGLVFSKCPPDMMYYEQKAKDWFNKGYLYLGFIFVDETQRHRRLGSLWLDKIKEQFPKNGLWLSIEDENLHKFYVKNGFKRVATLNNGESKEGIYVFEILN